MDFWGDNVGFDLEIDDYVNKKSDARAESIKGEKEGSDTAADKGAKHGNKAKDAGKKTEREGEIGREVENKAENKNRDGGGTGVDERNSDGAGDIFTDNDSHTIEGAMGSGGFRIIVKKLPEGLEDLGSFGEHKESENEDENEGSCDVAEGAEGGGEVAAEVFDEVGGERLSGSGNLTLKILNAETIAETVNNIKIEGGIINSFGESADKTDGFADDGGNNDGEKNGEKANNNNIG